MSRFARNLDGNHKAIVLRFKHLGCTVMRLESSQAGCPDLLVGRAGVDQQVEVKDGAKVKSARQMTPAQLEHQARWGGRRPVLCECPEDADGIVARMVRASVVMRSDVEVDADDYARPVPVRTVGVPTPNTRKNR